MLRVEVGSVHEIGRDGDNAAVVAQTRVYDNLEGYVMGTLWDVTWTLRYDGVHWRLLDSQGEQLEQWKATYFK
jgi:hypothetical protein